MMRGLQMSNNLDYEFSFGAGHCLKGKGWRGLVALGLLLTALVGSCLTCSPAIGSVVRYVLALR